jgi:hypothetical protein
MDQLDALKRDGFSVVDSFLNQGEVVTLCDEINALVPGEGVSLRKGRVFGARNLLQRLPSLRNILRADFLGSCELGGLIGDQARPVRCIFFDKNPSANWTVAWHQDLTISVRRKREVEGFKLWTTKAGVHHVQPPLSILEHMLTLRIHLDRTDESNGALRVIPGSHQLGRMDPNIIKELTATEEPRVCRVDTGGAMFMKPLLLHSSLSSRNPAHRRVLHIEFSDERLPGGLEWCDDH